MSLPPGITFEDFRRLVEMLQTTIQGMADLANRVKALEEANDAHLTAALALKDSQQQLYEAQKAQQEVNSLVKQTLDTVLRAIGQGPASTIQ
jgi:hypothetical protein